MIVEISYLNFEGKGVATGHDGKMYFVAGALPQDMVEIEPFISKKKYRDAKLIRIVRPSPHRQTPICPVFETCGGCDYLHFNYEAQVKEKERLVQHLLSRNGWKPTQWHPIQRANPNLHYRTRVQFHVEGQQVGFFKPRSHTLVPIEHCYIAHPKINEFLENSLIPQVKNASAEAPVPSRIEVQVNEDASHIALSTSPGNSLGTSFSQIHFEQNQFLRNYVMRELEIMGARSVLELFAGDGNLTKAYRKLPSIEHILAVERDEKAVGRATQEFKDTQCPFVRFLPLSIGRSFAFQLKHIIERELELKSRWDTLIVDPPRTGIPFSLRRFLEEYPHIERILYVSCHPHSLVQDIREIASHFTMKCVQLIDMFPQTKHVEIVTVLEQRKGSSALCD